MDRQLDRHAVGKTSQQIDRQANKQTPNPSRYTIIKYRYLIFLLIQHMCFPSFLSLSICVLFLPACRSQQTSAITSIYQTSTSTVHGRVIVQAWWVIPPKVRLTCYEYPLIKEKNSGLLFQGWPRNNTVSLQFKALPTEFQVSNICCLRIALVPALERDMPLSRVRRPRVKPIAHI